MAHFILLKTEEYIRALALMFVQEIWHLYLSPESNVSDRDA